MDDQLELELRKVVVEREIRRQLFAYHEAMNRADYATMATLLSEATITVCNAPRHRAGIDPLSSLGPDQLMGVIRGGDQFAAACQATWLTYGGDPRMQFGATNVMVEVADSLESATCHAYFFLFQALGPQDHPADQDPPADQDHPADQAPGAPRDFPLQAISCGRYFDTYRYLDTKWQIVAREIYADLAGDASAHMLVP
jgi:hypothetical protein